MSDGNFKCGVHDFSTDSPVKWYDHLTELEHIHDLNTKCQCGKSIHVKPKIKLSLKLHGIPKGFMCDECKKHIQNTPEIKEKKIQ